MFLTFVPFFNAEAAPLTFRSFIIVTESPSCNMFPFESLTTNSSSFPAFSVPGVHSCAHSGQTKRFPSS